MLQKMFLHKKLQFAILNIKKNFNLLWLRSQFLIDLENLYLMPDYFGGATLFLWKTNLFQIVSHSFVKSSPDSTLCTQHY